MAKEERLEVEGGFELEVPPGWAAEADEEGGVLVSAEGGPGLLHVAAFPQDEDEAADPAEELYAFLAEQGVELEEDEVEDVELEGGAELAFCEYLTEDEEDQEAATYWLVGVATAPGTLVFSNYSCPAGAQDRERETVLRILRSLRLREGGPR